jgi:hypothetical protein
MVRSLGAGGVDRPRARPGRGWVLRAACALVVLPWLPGGVAHAATTATATFSSPGQYSFSVPPGVTSIAVTAVGGAGGSCAPDIAPASPGPWVGGSGAQVAATVAVSPGERLLVGVGTPGGRCGVPAGGAGGTGGGGSGGAGLVAELHGGGGGGGASLVGVASPSPGFPGSLVVAGAGGGASGAADNGALAGGPAGSGGSAYPDAPAAGGGGGTLTSGGAGASPTENPAIRPGRRARSV